MGSQFESLMHSGNHLLDEYFDESLVLRAKGQAIELQGTIILVRVMRTPRRILPSLNRG